MTLDAALASFGGATQFFLRIPTIPGDVTVVKHENDIDVQSFSWDVKGQTHAAFTPLTVTKFVDPASPLLMKQAANQNTLPTVTLFGEKPGSPAFGYYQLTLNNSKVTRSRSPVLGQAAFSTRCRSATRSSPSNTRSSHPPAAPARRRRRAGTSL